MQFILQLKLCLYTIVHFLLEEFKISLKSSSSTQSLHHTIRGRVGVKVQVFSAGVKVGVWSPKFSNPGVGVVVQHENKDTASLLPSDVILPSACYKT